MFCKEEEKLSFKLLEFNKIGMNKKISISLKNQTDYERNPAKRS